MFGSYKTFWCLSIIAWNCLTLKLWVFNWIIIDWQLMKPELLIEIVWMGDFVVDKWLIID